MLAGDPTNMCMEICVENSLAASFDGLLEVAFGYF